MTDENFKTTAVHTSENSMKVFKIIVIGDSNVGKTSLTYRFCEGTYLDNVEATIGVDFREKTVVVDGELVKLQLWDTAGQERFRKSMVQHYYRNAHAVVVVYDVTKLSSFNSIPQWLEECDKHNLTSRIPRILVGNKCDCPKQQAINTNMAQKLADKYNMPLFETSAQMDSECDNIEAIFLTLAHKLKSQKPLMPPIIPRSLSSYTVNINQQNNSQTDDSSCLC